MLLIIIIAFALITSGPPPVRTGPGRPAAGREKTDAERRREARDREKLERLRDVVEQQQVILDHYSDLYDRTAARLELIQSSADREKLEEKLFLIDQKSARAYMRIRDAQRQINTLTK